MHTLYMLSTELGNAQPTETGGVLEERLMAARLRLILKINFDWLTQWVIEMEKKFKPAAI